MLKVASLQVVNDAQSVLGPCGGSGRVADLVDKRFSSLMSKENLSLPMNSCTLVYKNTTHFHATSIPLPNGFHIVSDFFFSLAVRDRKIHPPTLKIWYW